MRTLLAAVAFLTRIPVPAPVPGPASFGAAAFGLVGAGMGLVAAIPLLALGDRVPWVAAVLAVALLAVLSGGLHLDGVADTADALVAPAGARAERARKDPAIGAAGAVALILVLALEAAAVAQLPPAIATGTFGTVGIAVGLVAPLVVAAAWGRAVAVGLTLVARRRAGDEGLAARFAAAVRPIDALLAAAVPIAIAAGASAVTRSTPVAIGLGVGLAVGALLAGLIVLARGALDGDGLGAAVELSEAAVLVASAVAFSAPLVRPL